MINYRRWPRWLCWLFGHEPMVFVDNPSSDNRRCLCGAREIGSFEDFSRPKPWRRRSCIATLDRWLP